MSSRNNDMSTKENTKTLQETVQAFRSALEVYANMSVEYDSELGMDGFVQDGGQIARDVLNKFPIINTEAIK